MKRLLKPFIIITLLLIPILVFSYKHFNSKNISAKTLDFTTDEKKSYEYDFELPKDIVVKDIINDSQLLVIKGNDILIYDYKKQSYDKPITSKKNNEDFIDAKIYNDKVFWSTTSTTSTRIICTNLNSKINTIIDESNTQFRLKLNISKGVITYCWLSSDNSWDIRYLDCTSLKTHTIYSIPAVPNNDSKLDITQPTILDNNILWSVTKYTTDNNNTTENIDVYKYDLKLETTELLSKDEKNVNPQITDGIILATKINHINVDGGQELADYIVKWNPSTNSWERFLDEQHLDLDTYNHNTVIDITAQNGIVYWRNSIQKDYYIYRVSDNKFFKLYGVQFKDDPTTIQINIANENFVNYSIKFNDKYMNVIKILN